MIKKTINIIFKIFLAVIPNKYIRAKLKADWTKLFIKKYVKIALLNSTPINMEPEMPIIFQYWEQGFKSAPDMVKICTNSIDKYANEFKHVILDYKTIEDYVEIPSFIYDLKNKGKIKTPMFSDILRSCLLAQRPSFWIDCTILLTGNIPSYIKETDFLMFKGLKKTPENFKAANYFIFSKKPNKFVVQLRNAIIEYWKDNDFLVSYFVHPHFISLLAKENEEFFNKIPTYDEALTLQFADKLFKQADEKLFLDIVSNFPIHKLSYKIPKKADISGTYYEKLKEKYNA